MGPFELLPSPLEPPLRRLFASAERSIFVASPYISREGLSILADSVAEGPPSCGLEVLTSITLPNLRERSLDVREVAEVYRLRASARVVSLPGLHAKVYVADDCRAIVASGNLTGGGLRRNYEYGVAVSDPEVAAGIVRDMRGYASLGSPFTEEELGRLAREVDAWEALRMELDCQALRTGAGRRERTKEREVRELLLRNRIKDRGITSIFSDTIRFLLRAGPCATRDLHARIRDIHPDICDDSIDRVIDGQHFGKLWKHDVRNAQQALKRRGRIALRDGRWELLA
ncbi:MAG TPA: phospholipase D-like domain-containing protein [Planctomycetota bacterium]|jgi:phosphatidylserine/phosphatidylglycerophosphate/cardiolipin synthase-like enzyme|nr:phospholipase D-like domain-containing protein [Planctomycetota bacterium]